MLEVIDFIDRVSLFVFIVVFRQEKAPMKVVDQLGALPFRCFRVLLLALFVVFLDECFELALEDKELVEGEEGL